MGTIHGRAPAAPVRGGLRLVWHHPAGARASGARKCTQTINFPPRPALRSEAGVRPPPAASRRRAPHSGPGG